MQVVLDIESYLYCPYRCVTRSECVYPYVYMRCVKDDDVGFPIECPLVALSIKQTNDSIKFIE